MDFQELKLKQYAALIEDENDEIALLANTSAFLYEILEDVNWVGFYFVRENELVLGPFQGKQHVIEYHFPKEFVVGLPEMKKQLLYRMFMNLKDISLAMLIVRVKLYYLYLKMENCMPF